MEIVSEGSLESISRPSTSKSSRSSARSISVQGSLDILSPEEPLHVVELEIAEDLAVTDVGDDSISDETARQLRPVKSAEDDLEKKDLVSNTGLKRLPFETESDTAFVIDSQEHDDVDPKIRKGLEKIKKLDVILSEKIKKEKEVKRCRLEHERLWREQIENLEQNREAELGKPVDLGPAHMLALGTADDSDASLYEDSPPVTPLFATQPIVDDKDLLYNVHLHQRSTGVAYGGHKTTTDRGENSSEHSKSPSETSRSRQDEEQSEQGTSEHKKNRRNKKTGRKDYIKRNIQLAADANNTIAMTEEEKKRLDELLSDMGNLMDEPSDQDLASLSFYGRGFLPSADEAKQLEDIDFRLKALLPAEEYDVFCSSSMSEHDIVSQVHTPRSEATNGTLHEESHTFGELVLLETKEMRDMKERLLSIEEKLDRFKNLDHDEGILSESLLRQLVDGSSRTTSQATTIFDHMTSSVTSSVNYDAISYDDTASFTTDTPSSVTALEQ